MRATRKINAKREADEARETHRRILAHIEKHGVTLPNRCARWVSSDRHGSHSFPDGDVLIYCPGV